jgi:hypothetical protein
VVEIEQEGVVVLVAEGQLLVYVVEDEVDVEELDLSWMLVAFVEEELVVAIVEEEPVVAIVEEELVVAIVEV